MKRADEIMKEALQTYSDRRAVYGDSYNIHGRVMAEMFPNGVKLETPLDFARFSIFNLIAIKLVRYSVQYEHGHQDSIHDLGVYAFVMEELDQRIEEPLMTGPPPKVRHDGHDWVADAHNKGMKETGNEEE